MIEPFLLTQIIQYVSKSVISKCYTFLSQNKNETWEKQILHACTKLNKIECTGNVFSLRFFGFEMAQDRCQLVNWHI